MVLGISPASREEMATMTTEVIFWTGDATGERGGREWT